MSHFVLDASITLSWLLPDEANDSLLGVRADLIAAESVWVAGHWHLEVCNSLWMAERRKRLDAAGVARAAALFTQLDVTVDPETHAYAASQTLALSREHMISVYDAAYLELALRRGATLTSLDGPLRTVAEKLGVKIAPKKLPDEY